MIQEITFFWFYLTAGADVRTEPQNLTEAVSIVDVRIGWVLVDPGYCGGSIDSVKTPESWTATCR